MHAQRAIPNRLPGPATTELALLAPQSPAGQTPATTEVVPPQARMLSVVVAYEDAGTRNRAMGVCQQTIGEQWPGLKFECTEWRFDLLDHPAVAQAALEAAAKADLFICCVRAENELPAVLRAWIEIWVPKNIEKDRALIALVESSRDEAAVRAPAVIYLQRVASEAKMTFFARFFQGADELSGCSEATVSQRANAVTGVLSEILSYRGGFPQGGIND